MQYTHYSTGNIHQCPLMKYMDLVDIHLQKLESKKKDKQNDELKL